MTAISKLKCVLCCSEAVTTAAQIPVCKEHYAAYQKEGRKCLPFSERVVYQKLLKAAA